MTTSVLRRQNHLLTHLNSFTNGLARWIWFQILTGSRKGIGPRIFRSTLKVLPPRLQSAYRKSMVQQERFARRFAVPLLRFFLNVMWLSFLIAFCVSVATQLFERGILTFPEK